MTAVGYGDFNYLTGPGRIISALAMLWGIIMAALLVQVVLSHSQLSKPEHRVASVLSQKEGRHRLKQRAAAYIQAAWASYLERLQRSQAAAQGASLLGKEPLHADPRFCRTMRKFRGLRKVLMSPDDDLFLIFKGAREPPRRARRARRRRHLSIQRPPAPPLSSRRSARLSHAARDASARRRREARGDGRQVRA